MCKIKEEILVIIQILATFSTTLMFKILSSFRLIILKVENLDENGSNFLYRNYLI